MFIKEAIQVILVGLLVEGASLDIQPVHVEVDPELAQVRLRENKFEENRFVGVIKGIRDLGNLLSEKLLDLFPFGFGYPVVLFLLVLVHELLAPVLPKLPEQYLY